mgnify:FL=1
MYFVKKSDKENSFLDDFTNFFNQGFGKDLKTDIVEKDNQYEVTMDVPGVNKSDISISFDDQTLTIDVKRVKEEKNDEKKNYICKERSVCDYSRSFYLENGDESNVKAKLSDGILMICVGKKAQVNTKKTIAIE